MLTAEITPNEKPMQQKHSKQQWWVIKILQSN